VPTANSTWIAEPYEAQYLKVYDVTPPPAPAQPANSTSKSYVMGSAVTFQWAASPSNTADDNITAYKLVIRSVGNDVTVFDQNVGNVTSYEYTGVYGDNLYAVVLPISVASIEGTASSSSASVELVDPAGDLDGDGMNNADEETAGTDFNDRSSKLKVVESIVNETNHFTLSWRSVLGISYGVQSKEVLTAASWFYEPSGTSIAGTGSIMAWSDPNPINPVTLIHKFYRVIVE
jgi:hypothetical protein